jgi:hypothetical protein
VRTTPCGPWTTELFTAALSKLGAPAPGQHNLGVLQSWCPYEGTGAGNNPLAAGWDTGGTCGCWNSIVFCYCTPAQGAQALARIWESNYPAITQALQEDWTLEEWACSAELQAEVRDWGTEGFAAYLAAMGCASSPPPPVNPCQGVTCEGGYSCVGGQCVPPADPCQGVVCGAGYACRAGFCEPSGGAAPAEPEVWARAGLVVGLALTAGCLARLGWALWKPEQSLWPIHQVDPPQAALGR